MPSATFANVSCMPTAHTPANKPVRMQINAQNNAHPLALNQTKRKPKNPAATITGAKKIISTPSKLDARRGVIMRALRTAFAESPGGGVFFREAKTRLARGPSYVRALIPHNDCAQWCLATDVRLLTEHRTRHPLQHAPWAEIGGRPSSHSSFRRGLGIDLLKGVARSGTQVAVRIIQEGQESRDCHFGFSTEFA